MKNKLYKIEYCCKETIFMAVVEGESKYLSSKHVVAASAAEAASIGLEDGQEVVSVAVVDTEVLIA